MQHPLKSKPSLGKIQLLDENDTILEEFEIGLGHFSIIPKEDYFLINFWVRAEFDVGRPDEGNRISWGPTLEILTKTPKIFDELEIKLPPKKEMQKDWDTHYSTGYYNGWHNYFDEAEIKIEKKVANMYKISFGGIPDEDGQQAKVIGECEIQLSKDMKRYW